MMLIVYSESIAAGQAWERLLRAENYQTQFLELSRRNLMSDSAPLETALFIIDFNTAKLAATHLLETIYSITISPILVIAPYPYEVDLLNLYEAGASECIVKSVSPLIFLAKVKAWLRMSKAETKLSNTLVTTGEFRLDVEQRYLTFSDGVPIKLTALETRLLHMLMIQAERIVSTDALIQQTWGYKDGNTPVLKNLIYRLRRKIENDPKQPRHLLREGDGYVFFA